MLIALDTNVLIAILGDKDHETLHCPESDRLVDKSIMRGAALIDLMRTNKATILIPSPVLAEFLIGVPKHKIADCISLIQSRSCMRIANFDQMSAIECAMLIDESELKTIDSNGSKAKNRADRQILAICKANNVDELWTHDKGLYKKALRVGIPVKTLMSIEPMQIQAPLSFEPA